jgi:predicted enzyme related to lactoylglutathione lyase
MSGVGIGGVFFRASEPEALMDWYREHLGVGGDDPFHWTPEPGQTLFMPFPRDSDHFPADKQWMLNLRVSDLATLLAKLRTAGIAVTTNPEWDTPDTGKFARIHDPEGNPVELWEPPAD